MDHRVRRSALGAGLEERGIDALLVTRQLHARYLTGFTGSNGQLLMRADRAVLFTDGRYTEQAARECEDLERVTYAKNLREVLGEHLREPAVARLGFEADDLTVAGHGRLTEALGPDVTLIAVTGAVEALRAVKDEDERDLVRRAQAATDAAFEDVVDLLAVGFTERRVADELERLLREHGAEGLAFESIVAFGEDAAEPHHEPTHRVLEEGDVVKLDFGGLVGGYHADMTRTVAFGTPAPELRKVHDIVREAQQAGVDAVRAGVTGAELDAIVRGMIAEAGYGERFVHGLGHGVGLEIHEAPWLGRDIDEPLPAGAIVTVEPGVYLPGLGGVRIEDMVEVTEDGGRVVGTSPRDLIEL